MKCPMDAVSDPQPTDQLPSVKSASAAAGAVGLFRHPAWAVVAVLLIGFNLRPSITTVALFLGDIKRDLGVSVFGISVLAMLPVVCLGLFAPAAPALARRFGVETVLFVSLLGITIGSLVRSF